MKYQLYHESIKDYNPDLETIKIEDLDTIEQHSIEYINIYNVLELEDNFDLGLLLSKLRLKGTMCLVGADINKLCELYLDNILSLSDFQNFTLHKKLYPLSYIRELLIKNNFKVLTIKTDNFIYYIECGRLE